MRCLILYAALLGAVAGSRSSPSYAGNLNKGATALQPEITTLRFEMSSTTEAPASSTPAPTTTTASQSNLVEEVVSELPVSLPPILEEVNLPNLPNRRVVTYDQRQEGQYNIRADLDNFMIVLIPPSPSDGLGLLDLLTKSSLRRTSHASKKKKHYSSTTALKPEALKHLNYFRSHEQQLAGSSRGGEFLEGRTPYHVDIASLNEEEIQPRLNPDRQVDVLPPSYPVAYQHLMKPYHLEAESSLLPPSEIGLQHNADSNPSQNAGYYRFARYIRGDNFLDSNRVTSSNRLGPQSTGFRRQQLPVYRSDLSMGAAQLYPPLDVPQFSYHVARNFGSKSSPSSSSSNNDDIDSKQSLDSDLSYGEIIIPPAHLPLEDDLELALNDDDSLLEGEAKALLSDGIERCAPGKRRDSYGVCREIEGY